ncbi:MAG: mycofactocin system GMC family oxidoreductase MftG [Leucobacter sp.]
MTASRGATRIAIVGGGASGAVLAARLSEDPGYEVTLIEAGPGGPTPSDLLDGGSIPAALPGHPANWGYTAELRPGHPTVVPRGRLLGGSTAINGGYFVRATPSDFADWAATGGPSWEYERALPLLAALENDLDFGTEPGHGRSGPMRLRRPPQQDALTAAFRGAALELGFPEEPDKNAAAIGGPPRPPGVGPVPSNIIDSVRINTAMAYLTPALGRFNLTILGDTRALRVLFDAGQRVTGVETDHGIIEADEVVLCAGSVATPQLLMLSGIGPRTELDAHGIAVLADLPVGERVSDHPNLAVGWSPTRSLHEDRDRFAFPTALNFDSSGPAGSYPEGDLEILLVSKPLGALFAQPASDASGEEMQLLVALQAPSNRGRLSLRSADPLDAPRIEYHYLDTADDRARMRIGVRTAAALLRSQAFKPFFGSFTSLDDATLGDGERLDAWVAAHLGTAIHLSGTAAMGTVTDGSGRVRGVGGLRVADTSILPRVPSRGPFNTAVFIGEFVAGRMLAE